MTSIATRPLTIDEFLALPEATEPSLEFLRGEVIEKPMPSDPHGRATSELIGRLYVYFRTTKAGRVINEVRHVSRGQAWVYQPDINIRLRRANVTTPRRGPVERTPEMAIEVLPPDDRISRWIERVNLYLAAGTQLLWVIDTEEETLRTFQPGPISKTYTRGDIVTAEPVLTGFELDLNDYFDAIADDP